MLKGRLYIHTLIISRLEHISFLFLNAISITKPINRWEEQSGWTDEPEIASPLGMKSDGTTVLGVCFYVLLTTEWRENKEIIMVFLKEVFFCWHVTNNTVRWDNLVLRLWSFSWTITITISACVSRIHFQKEQQQYWCERYVFCMATSWSTLTWFAWTLPSAGRPCVFQEGRQLRGSDLCHMAFGALCFTAADNNNTNTAVSPRGVTPPRGTLSANKTQELREFCPWKKKTEKK